MLYIILMLTILHCTGYHLVFDQVKLLKQVTEEYVVLKEIKHHWQRLKRDHAFLKNLLKYVAVDMGKTVFVQYLAYIMCCNIIYIYIYIYIYNTSMCILYNVLTAAL